MLYSEWVSDVPKDPEVARYAHGVTRSAHDIATEIRHRLPGVGVKKLHKLLYYCQGHHLAHSGRQLFRDSVSAWDMGPVVGRLWYEENNNVSAGSNAELNEDELNTVGYVLSRYGRLSAQDLEHMTHAEAPWRRADEGRSAGESTLIRPEWMLTYFRSPDDEDDDLVVDVETSKAFVAGAAERRRRPAQFDTVEGILARTSVHGR